MARRSSSRSRGRAKPEPKPRPARRPRKPEPEPEESASGGSEGGVAILTAVVLVAAILCVDAMLGRYGSGIFF